MSAQISYPETTFRAGSSCYLTLSLWSGVSLTAQTGWGPLMECSFFRQKEYFVFEDQIPIRYKKSCNDITQKWEDNLIKILSWLQEHYNLNISQLSAGVIEHEEVTLTSDHQLEGEELYQVRDYCTQLYTCTVITVHLYCDKKLCTPVLW